MVHLSSSGRVPRPVNLRQPPGMTKPNLILCVQEGIYFVFVMAIVLDAVWNVQAALRSCNFTFCVSTQCA